MDKTAKLRSRHVQRIRGYGGSESEARGRTGYIQDGRLQNFHALIVQFKEGSPPQMPAVHGS
jgi:hypothetical protein